MPLADNIRVMIVADRGQQRLALADTMRELGIDMVETMDSAQLLRRSSVPVADLWLVDVDEFNEKLEEKIVVKDPNCVLVGFKSAPYLNSEQAYKKWQKSLIRKIGDVLNTPISELVTPIKKETNTQPWQYVVLLGASMGGPEAVKEFLDNLSPELPLAILLAHHFDAKNLDTLPRVLTRHNEWRCQVITTTQSLQSGMCLIAPIDKQIVFDGTGRVILTKDDWQSDYRPNIGEILRNASEVYGSQLVGIILSGMGNDGSQHAKSLPINRSLFWAQDPKSCASASQPQAFIDTGICQFIGTPKDLADKMSMLAKSLVNAWA